MKFSCFSTCKTELFETTWSRIR